ncbi:fibroblast growth factor-binding protein 3 [Xenopus laevis]|uniref:Fibroblast growth factor-binding protein 3 n=2 Tax=Xenopus laevis TaxID=8355 RepID=A0A1L8FET0_XENLA|nr:fibroblast growth factor-binding protein 3 [Xenopus laevis]OCT70098.1 hypothetical protein XELAEV_18037019mg [Xenopus laevis]
MLLNYTPSSISTNEMRLSRVISFLPFIICLIPAQGVLGKTEKATSKRGDKQGFARSGEFSTKHQHECTWEIAGDQIVNMTLVCQQQGVNSYTCSYTGDPLKCPSYKTKAKQYWKQILGKFKKVRNACEEKTLRSHICKKSAAVESQLIKVDAGAGEEGKNIKTKGKTHMKEPGKGTEEKPRSTEANEDSGGEQKSSSKKRKPFPKSNHKPNPPTPSSSLPSLSTAAREVNDDIVELNEDLAETYCAEKWNSLCSFFVNFWSG